jgi:glutamyl/glutaminyl-tRNA synthetase
MRAPFGRPSSGRVTPAARWSCAWRISTPTAAAPPTLKPQSKICAGWASAGTKVPVSKIPDLDSPNKGGPFAPYVQSLRRASYLAAWRKLFHRGFIYPCRCSRKDTALAAPHEGNPASPQSNADLDPLDDEPIYPGTCRPRTAANEPPLTETDTPDGINWRFRVPDGEAIEFEDRNLGPQRFVAGKDFGDFVVWRRDGVPSYQLACVADDAAMGITEVVRGADLLKSTARQILLNRALGYSNPAWFHCHLTMDHNGRRLAKRHDSLSLRTLRQRGLTPMNILLGELPVEV